MPRSHSTSTVASLVFILLLVHASVASPIVRLAIPVAKPVVIKTSVNATSALPLRGPNHYMALGSVEGSSLESRELRNYFEEAELVARGLEIGEVEPITAPVSQAETATTTPDATQRSLFSFLSRPVFAVKNPKYVWNPKAHPPRTSTTAGSTWTSVTPSAIPTVPASSSTTKKASTITQKTTTTTTSAAPTSTLVACALTADCAGQPIPDFSHQYCASRICSFRCNSGFTLSKGACIKNKGSSTSMTTKVATTTAPPTAPSPTGCFPSSRSDIPTTPATASSLQQWWCPESNEYAFLGFSYALYSCPSQSQLLADFKRMKSDFNSRYVRLYGYCDEWWMNDALVEAAAGAGIGIYGLIWFGFEGTDEWKGRRDALVKTIQTNPKAPYVYRNIAVGSEPLYDWALEPWALANEINSLKAKMAPYGIKITTSEMPYGYQIHNNAPAVAQAIDFVEANVLPFFDGSATTGDRAWGMVSWSLDFFRQVAPGKRIVMAQTGFPSDTSVWKANSPSAVASVWSEKGYFDLLDSKCEEFRWNGGVGWFAHIWSDSQLGGWGILDWNGNKKFDFKPRTTC